MEFRIDLERKRREIILDLGLNTVDNLILILRMTRNAEGSNKRTGDDSAVEAAGLANEPSGALVLAGSRTKRPDILNRHSENRFFYAEARFYMKRVKAALHSWFFLPQTMLHVVDQITPPNSVDYKSQLLDVLKTIKYLVEKSHSKHPTPFVLISSDRRIILSETNSVCTFVLNLAVFLLVAKTCALTMNVAGVVKNWLLIAFSWPVIKDIVKPINLFGHLRQKKQRRWRHRLMMK
ncbi:hypothetical protein M8C21_022023, partial [Ambrosia artemisiifolia]